MNKPVRIIFLDEADLEYKKLNEIAGQQAKNGLETSQEMKLLKSIKQKLDFIKANPFYGDNVQKKLIPKEYVIKYKADNLWRVKITNSWRMLYTIKGSEIEIICFVLDIVDHDKYDRKFGYKKC